MTKSEFIAEYVLNRARAKPHGLEAPEAARSAAEAWDKYIRPYETTPPVFPPATPVT